jgi:prophage DNA circulation protein
MATIFDGFKPMSFAGIKFPYVSYEVQGAYRIHNHEYPHSPGGAIEKLGRSLYEFSVTVDFRGALDSPKYPQLITDLGVLRGLFEDGTTEKLHIPHLGTVQAMAVNWREVAKNTDRSGINGTIKFIEDQSSAFLVLEIIQVRTQQLNEAAANFAAVPKPPDENIFRQIDNAISSVLAIKDQAQLFGSLVASKIDGLTQLLRMADETVKGLDSPPYNTELVEALHALWDSVIQLGKDIAQKGDSLKSYTVPVTMSATQAAIAIYGDSEKTIDLLQLNVIPDPYAIPANTTLRYYEAA